jgi:pimeloyl-ACP methyl ester carboxylesterase
VYASLTESENRQSFVRTLRGVIDPAGQAVSAHDRLYLARHLPTLVVWGARDRMIPVSHATAAHASMPDSELAIFESSGHFPHTDEPERFSRTVNAFIERTRAANWDDGHWRAALRVGPTRPIASRGRPGS